MIPKRLFGLKPIKLIAPAAAMLAAAIFAAHFGSAGFSNARAAAEAPSFLFVQAAQGTEFKDGKLTLIAPATVFFSDRPLRIGGHMSNDAYLRAWSQSGDSFQKDPPNAVLSTLNPQGRPTQALVVLKNPRLEGGNLSYDVDVLRGNLPPKGPEGALFIDGIGWGCPGGEYVGAPCWADNAFDKG